MPLLQIPRLPLELQPRGSDAPQSSPAGGRSLTAYRDIPPLRESPFQADPHDGARAQFVVRRWHSQDALLRARDRQIEENVRMICGQQWSVWSELTGRFVDITRYLSDDERRWRQFPVMNRLLLWFMLLHARMTENPAVITFQPATADRIDADLAEVMDTVFKTVWQRADMLEVIDQLAAWMIPGGTAYLKSRIDPTKGELRRFQQDATLQLLGPDGQPIIGADGQPIQRTVPGVPFGPDGQPRARLLEDGGVEMLGEPHAEHEGDLVVDVLSGLEVRGEWGSNIPWHRKAWHLHRSYQTPEQVYNFSGLDLAPDVTGADADNAMELQRMLFGSGFFGAAGGKDENIVDADTASKTGLIEVFEYWGAPCNQPGMQQTDENPGGRLLITTRTKVLRDGPRYAAFPNVSPIRRFDFVRVPGRPSGTSPQEMLNGPARTRNRLVSQILQHTSLSTNPIKLIDKASGIQEGQATNKPGLELYGNFPAGTEPLRYVNPPALGEDTYKVLQILTQEFDELGNIPGALGTPPAADSSGELVKELRFNSDRFISPTQRRMVLELARTVEDWIVMLPICWDEPKILKAAGDDNAAATLTVLPDMFKLGKINVIPDIESMLPEGRGERQARIWRMYEAGLFGQPSTPDAINRFYDEANFPHMGRAVRPGGTDRSTAAQNVAKLLRGEPAQRIPIFEWYDHNVHLQVTEHFMKSPEYLRVPMPVMQQFVLHRENIIAAALMAQQRAAMRQAGVQMQMAHLQAAVGADAATQQLAAHVHVAKVADQAGIHPPPGAPVERTEAPDRPTAPQP